MIDYDRIRDFYDRQPRDSASASDSKASEVARGSARLQNLAEAHHLARVLRVEAGQRVLDLGAGSASWSLFFAERGARVTCIERAPSLAEAARNTAAQHGLDIDCRVGSIIDPPLLHTERFDMLHIGNALMHIDDADLDQVSTVVRAHTRPGSLLVVREPIDTRGRGAAASCRRPQRYRELFAADFRLLYERNTVSHLMRDTHSIATSPGKQSWRTSVVEQLLPLVGGVDYHLLRLEERLRASRLRGFLGEPGVSQRFFIFARKYR